MKEYPNPTFLGQVATTTGNRKEKAALTIQFVKEPMEDALALIVFGKSSANNTHTVTPDEIQKENANPISKINKPYP